MTALTLTAAPAAAPAREPLFDRALLPRLTRRTALTVLSAGLAADAAWEVWARLVSPALVGVHLRPTVLVKNALGVESELVAQAVHGATGVVAYPLGYLLLALPLQAVIRRAGLPLPGIVTAIGYGVGLWVFALWFLASVLAGAPAFLGFAPSAWSSLGGHVLFALVIAMVFRLRGHEVR